MLLIAYWGFILGWGFVGLRLTLGVKCPEDHSHGVTFTICVSSSLLNELGLICSYWEFTYRPFTICVFSSFLNELGLICSYWKSSLTECWSQLNHGVFWF
jgi:hypothetical protein